MFKTFDETDWMTFAGCEPFADGTDPMVNYEIKVDDLDAVAIVDGTGFYLQVLTPDGETVSEIYSEQEDGTSSGAIFRFLAGVEARRANGVASYETGELLDFGFVFVDPDYETRRADRQPEPTPAWDR